MTSKLQALKRLVRHIATFPSGVLLASLSCSLFWPWILFDSQFRPMLAALQWRFFSHPATIYLDDELWNRHCQSDAFGLRFLLLGSMSLVAAFAILTLAVHAASRLTLGRLLGLTFVCAAWLSLIASYQQVHETGLLLRIKRELPRLRRVAQSFHNEWPTNGPSDRGWSPEIGEYYVSSTTGPDRVFVAERREFHMSEEIGTWITRSSSGAIRFELAVWEHGYDLEFQPHSPQPPPTAIPITDHWYLINSAREH